MQLALKEKYTCMSEKYLSFLAQKWNLKKLLENFTFCNPDVTTYSNGKIFYMIFCQLFSAIAVKLIIFFFNFK